MVPWCDACSPKPKPKFSTWTNLVTPRYSADELLQQALGPAAEAPSAAASGSANAEAIGGQAHQADPDLVMHLAAESRGIVRLLGLGRLSQQCEWHISPCQAVRSHLEAMPESRRAAFRFHHISTDEVFGSLAEGELLETTPYAPRSPYSASKAASTSTIGPGITPMVPAVLTNCSNNYGPWQYPEKLIPVVVIKAAAGETIPLWRWSNVRDWLYVDDHVEALLLAATRGQLGTSYCVGGREERNNRQVVEAICNLMDELRPKGSPHSRLISLVRDRPGHDRRYSIDATLIRTELGWKPRHTFEQGLESTVQWFLNNLGWCRAVQEANH